MFEMVLMCSEEGSTKNGLKLVERIRTNSYDSGSVTKNYFL